MVPLLVTEPPVSLVKVEGDVPTVQTWPSAIVTEPPVSLVKVEGDVPTVQTWPSAMFNAPALSHVPPVNVPDALMFTVPLLVTLPVTVRPPLPAPRSVEMVP